MMSLKKMWLVPLSFLTMTAFAEPVKLANYDDIRKSLLNGYDVKAIIDLKSNCKTISHIESADPPRVVLNIFSVLFNPFVISRETNEIRTFSNSLNAPDGSVPANYVDAEIAVTPAGQVNLGLFVVAFHHFKTILNCTYECNIGDDLRDGVRFFQMK